MATKAEELSVPKERRRHRGTGALSNKMRPPDKRRHEKELASLSKAISDQEASLKLVSWDSTQNLNTEISQLAAKLDQVEKDKENKITSLRAMEDEIPSLGKEVTEKKSEASRLIAGLRHNTEAKIDEAVSKLELSLQTRRHSLSEERKVRTDIESLIKSKDRLRAWQELKVVIDSMREKQANLRKERDCLYRVVRDLKEEVGSLKDAIAEKKAKLEHLNFLRKEAIAHKDTIEKEINDLKARRRQLQEEFRQQQQEYSAATEMERSQQREQERKQIELRREQRLSRKKQATDLLPQRRLQYDVEKQICSALISYVDKLSIGHSSTDHSPNATPSNQLDQSTPAEGVLMKREDEEVLVPTSYRKKSKRDKRRSAVGNKASKRFIHNATVFGQFNHIGLTPPSTAADLPGTLALLQEKLTFYSSKNETRQQAESEAGDSGVYSTALGDLHELSDTPFTTSQEDVSSDVSPKRSLTDPSSLKFLPMKTLTSPADQPSIISNGLVIGVTSPTGQPQNISNGLVGGSIRSLTSQSSTSSSVANAVTNGNEE